MHTNMYSPHTKYTATMHTNLYSPHHTENTLLICTPVCIAYTAIMHTECLIAECNVTLYIAVHILAMHVKSRLLVALARMLAAA